MKLNNWLRLENAIHEAVSMAHMLAATVNDLNEGKEEAVTFGIYKLQDMVRQTRAIFDQLHDEVRQIRIEWGEIVPLEEDEPTQKTVNLH
jgi:predicted component of type VI protein secretion system